MIRASGNSPWIWLIASMPFRSGIWRSIKVTSGRCERYFSTASRPLDASATSFISASPLISAAMPSRSRGWSSTVSTRISLGMVVIAPRFAEHPQSKALLRCFVSNRSGNSQLDFRARSGFAPKTQLCANSLGAFMDAPEPPVSGAPAFLQDCRLNASSIIAYAQAKQVMIVMYLGFNLIGMSMLESIAQQFAGYSINFVLQDGRQALPLTLYNHTEGRRISIPLLWGQFLDHCRERLCKVALASGCRTQVLNGAPAFRERLFRPQDRAIKGLGCFLRPPRKHI